ncbi:MAG: YkvA family protein [Paludibacteraceae bacterium]|nr:YkvA family protein [Paludibacteraceae bacterium]
MEKEIKTEELVKYEKHYSEDGLWKKLGNVAKKVGLKPIYHVLLLYYVLINESTPKKYKTMIIGALGYFILPIDMIPDFIPVVGYTDDVAAIAGAILAVAKCVSPEIKAQAKAKLKEWFGEYDELEIADDVIY